MPQFWVRSSVPRYTLHKDRVKPRLFPISCATGGGPIHGVRVVPQGVIWSGRDLVPESGGLIMEAIRRCSISADYYSRTQLELFTVQEVRWRGNVQLVGSSRPWTARIHAYESTELASPGSGTKCTLNVGLSTVM
jgi:hypothetical protein